MVQKHRVLESRHHLSLNKPSKHSLNKRIQPPPPVMSTGMSMLPQVLKVTPFYGTCLWTVEWCGGDLQPCLYGLVQIFARGQYLWLIESGMPYLPAYFAGLKNKRFWLLRVSTPWAHKCTLSSQKHPLNINEITFLKHLEALWSNK